MCWYTLALLYFLYSIDLAHQYDANSNTTTKLGQEQQKLSYGDFTWEDSRELRRFHEAVFRKRRTASTTPENSHQSALSNSSKGQNERDVKSKHVLKSGAEAAIPATQNPLMPNHKPGNEESTKHHPNKETSSDENFSHEPNLEHVHAQTPVDLIEHSHTETQKPVNSQNLNAGKVRKGRTGKYLKLSTKFKPPPKVRMKMYKKLADLRAEWNPGLYPEFEHLSDTEKKNLIRKLKARRSHDFEEVKPEKILAHGEVGTVRAFRNIKNRKLYVIQKMEVEKIDELTFNKIKEALSPPTDMFSFRVEAYYVDSEYVYVVGHAHYGSTYDRFLSWLNVIRNKIHEHIVLDIEEVRNQTAQIILAMTEEENLLLSHPENIYIMHNGQLRVGYFDLIKPVWKERKEKPGRLGYSPPRVSKDRPYSTNDNWWTLAVLMCEMFLGEKPTADHEGKIIWPQHIKVPKEFEEFVNKLLHMAPDEQVSLKNVEDDPFFKGFKWKLAKEIFDGKGARPRFRPVPGNHIKFVDNLHTLVFPNGEPIPKDKNEANKMREKLDEEGVCFHRVSDPKAFHLEVQLCKLRSAWKNKEFKKRRLKDFEDVSDLKPFGGGSYADVFLYRGKFGNKDFYAAKRFEIERMLRKEEEVPKIEEDSFEENKKKSVDFVSFVLREVEILQMIDSEFTIDMVAFDWVAGFKEEKSEEVYEEYVGITEEDVRIFVAELVEAVAHLHEKNIVHVDLKLENMLLNKNGHLQLTDYGLSFQMKRKRERPREGTFWYTAPEALDEEEKHKKINTKVCDWWSVGVVAYELLLGRTPFEWPIYHPEHDEGFFTDHPNMSRDDKVLRAILERKMYPLPFAVPLSPEAVSFLRDLMDYDVDRRLGAKGADEVRRHAWFQEIHVPEKGITGEKERKTSLPKIEFSKLIRDGNKDTKTRYIVASELGASETWYEDTATGDKFMQKIPGTLAWKRRRRKRR
ncbi:protein kinase domain-containing protein [Ditylenchus destructor]|uniref:non-specific serine/threonine protein kinase n=1 Tax=Ditylenchus destructor TaxID=166010 RepID=A0AAD4R2M8_9BILA|nr:protein kinase domain-containing protein [Ditylenchus destructor]